MRSSGPKTTPTQQIRSHAALRGIAALLVVGYHLQFGAWFRLPIETVSDVLTRGYLAVDLFFVLSGFIIAYVNDAGRTHVVTLAEAASFWRARFARLYPLLAFSLLVMILFRVIVSLAYLAGSRDPPIYWNMHSLGVLASQLLLVNAWLPGFEGWNIPTWSISAELVAYALFPLVVTARARAPRRCEAAMLAAAAVFYVVVAAGSGSLDIVGGMGAPLRCLAGFMLGMLLHAHRGWIARRGDGLLSLVQIGAIAAILVLLALPICDPLIVPAFVVLVGASWTDRGVAARLLARRPLLWLGDLSYSVYLNHVGVIEILGFGWMRLAPRLGLAPAIERLLWIALVYAGVIGVSMLTFVLVERPARQWLARRLVGHAAPPIATSPPGP